ncbi:MAG: macro domain-containing protein [Thermoanaerobaculia bacterium]|nr:macro domain-containing protein [Thermoanaerobaculia bacterium]
MLVQVTLVDVNPKMVAAWRSSFEENPEVTILSGSMLAQDVDAWVTPTNARGSMDGGLDGVIKQALGGQIEARVQAEIKRLYGGFLPVGCATCVESGSPKPRFLISTPTMVASSEDISDSMNVALACAAAFQAVHMQNARGGGIQSVALPGLGANTGRVPVEICADLMWTGYSLFRRRDFASFADMRAALEEELGPLGPAKSTSKPASLKGVPATGGANSKKPIGFQPPAAGADPDADFDDAE